MKNYSDGNFLKNLMGFESQGAVKYWNYVRLLLADDGIAFEERIGHKAIDLVNCMLNYGYAVLYSRACQALLSAQLNPYDSVIHVRQVGKPTFSFDFIELFRSQAVDRVVISMLQKGEEAEKEMENLLNRLKKSNK